jgi:hypothetical protein
MKRHLWLLLALFSTALPASAAIAFTTPVAAGNTPVIVLDSILTSAAAAGCSWRASLQ